MTARSATEARSAEVPAPVSSSTDLVGALEERDRIIRKLAADKALWIGACQGLSRRLMERNEEIRTLAERVEALEKQADKSAQIVTALAMEAGL